MYRKPLLILSILAAAACALQPKDQPPKPQAGQPAPEYKLLCDMCGAFDLKMTITPRPGAKPLIITATATREMALAGNFMVERVEAKDPMPFGSTSYMGFNADAKDGPRFEVVRMSTSTKCLMPERGTFDAATKTFTLRGEHETGGMTGRIRNEINISDLDHQIVETTLSFEGYSDAMKDMKVPEYHAMTMEYTRKAK